MAKGGIKKLITGRGYGFIQAEDGKEIFFHSTGLQGTDFGSLEEGQVVEFEKEPGPKGSRAINIRVKK